jgi:hypothetical protein
MPVKGILALALVFVSLASPALAQQPSCTPPLAPMLRVEFYFGLAIKDRAPVTRAEWEGFVGRELAPRFPGLTVLDARGAWRDGKREVREATKVVVVVTADGPAIQSAIAKTSEAYKARFHQSSVGIVTQPVCAAF